MCVSLCDRRLHHQEGHHYSEQVASQLIKKMVGALRYCHDHHIAHRCVHVHAWYTFSLSLTHTHTLCLPVCECSARVHPPGLAFPPCTHTCKHTLFIHSFIHPFHRDLKLENFLFESDEPDAELKLIDFGLSRWVGDES